VPVFLGALAEVISRDQIQGIQEWSWDQEVPREAYKADGDDSKGASIQPQDIPRVQVEELILEEPIAELENERINVNLEEDSDASPLSVSIGWILDQAYSRVRTRESTRRPIPSDLVEQWWDAAGELAMHIDGRRKAIRHREALERFVSQQGLRWLLSLGVLRRARGWNRFVTDLTQLYLAADFLRSFAEYECYDNESVRKYLDSSTQSFIEAVRNILYDISYSEQVDRFFQEVTNVQKAK
jgi:hypothetical protein